jgi:hypothetical protein
MQISSVKKEELALLISGLRALWIPDEVQRKAHERLQKQLEQELSTRFGLTLREAA